MRIDEYIGIPYEAGGRTMFAGDCWNLVVQVYRHELGIILPDWIGIEAFDLTDQTSWVSKIDEPKDFCLVREQRSGFTPDHWGVFIGGGVLSSEKPASNWVHLDRYLERHPDVEYYMVIIPEELKQ